MLNDFTIDLRHFEGEGGAAAPAGDAPEGAAAQTEGSETAVVTADADQARRQEFDRLIREEYKDLYDERAQQMINKRFKETKALEARSEALKKLEPMMGMLAQKYGVDATDAEALMRAIEEDDSYYESEAYDKGLTVDQLKYMKRLERENESFKKAQEELEWRNHADEQYRTWLEEGERLKQFYPGFDLETEVRGETGQRFLNLLTSNAGLSLRDAYELIHRDEILSGAMQLTAQTVRDKVVNDIRTRGARPSEAGAGSQAASKAVPKDPSKLSKTERDALSKQILAGKFRKA